ncbi:MAG: twin-arginine translocation signal domain-containing protein [Thermoguttaceae bacterium]
MESFGITRRNFMKGATIASALAAFCPTRETQASEGKPGQDWGTLLEDPVRKMFSGRPDLDKILTLFPRTQGPPAFDPKRITENVKKLETSPPVNTGHPLLDLSVKTGLAHIDATFRGDHPKYGAGTYAQEMHDGFPPTIIAAVDALSAWGLHRRAQELFRYWLAHFVRGDGTINYYGASISEYGQLLHTAALLEERAGTAGWWQEGFMSLDRMAAYLLQLRSAATKPDGLICGVPEADTRKDTARYFHNNGWVAKGLRRWAGLCERQKASPSTTITIVRKVSAELARDTLRAIQKTWPADPGDWWLPPHVEPLKRPVRLTGSWDIASYTNYRYWPELLSSGLLPKEMANRVVDARLSAGGQFCGMTRFAGHFDDWPLADYLFGLWSLGRKDDFLLSLYGHVAYHQAEGHLTAYEQVSFPPGKKMADYCLPCQLVAARAARLIQR